MAKPLWSAREAAEAVSGRLTEGGWTVSGVSIDTRTLQPGDLFVALTDRRDGHDFAQGALDAGAGAVLVSDPACASGPRLVVQDVLEGLQDLGAAARQRCSAVRVGVTGSVGKTGVKEAMAEIFRAAGKAHWSEKSYNNHWGVPLTLARMPADTERAVFEMGMNHAGEIEALTAQVRPHIALITKIAPAHLENLGSMDAIADAKSEIFTGLEADGIAVLPADDEFFPRLKAAVLRSRAGFLMEFGWAAGAAVRVLSYQEDGEGGTGELDVMGRRLTVRLRLPGAHQIVNAAGTIAAALAAGVEPELAGEALSRLQAGAGRGARFTAALHPDQPFTVIDESYNANPASMKAALTSLKASPVSGRGRRIAILGEMLELGPDSAAMHADLAGPIEDAGTDLVIAVGAHAKPLKEALEGRIEALWVADASAALQALEARAGEGDSVLIKGSNASGVHNIAAWLRKARHPADTQA